MRLTVSFMLNTKASKFRKKTDYKYMISLFFLTPSTQIANYKN